MVKKSFRLIASCLCGLALVPSCPVSATEYSSGEVAGITMITTVLGGAAAGALGAFIKGKVDENRLNQYLVYANGSGGFTRCDYDKFVDSKGFSCSVYILNDESGRKFALIPHPTIEGAKVIQPLKEAQKNENINLIEMTNLVPDGGPIYAYGQRRLRVTLTVDDGNGSQGNSYMQQKPEFMNTDNTCMVNSRDSFLNSVGNHSIKGGNEVNLHTLDTLHLRVVKLPDPESNEVLVKSILLNDNFSDNSNNTDNGQNDLFS